MQTPTATRVQDRHTGATGTLVNDRTAPVAIVKFDHLPEATWTDWENLA